MSQRPSDDMHSLERIDEQLRQSLDATVTDPSISPHTVETLRLLNKVFGELKNTTDEPEPLPSKIGRYEIQELIGQGRFGIVYRAQDPELKRLVALKRIKQEWVANAEVRKRFLHEAEVVAKLDHPGIVPVLDAGRDDSYWYLVFALCDGSNLQQWRLAQGPSVQPRKAAEIIRRIAIAVDYGHRQGVIHRDLTPSNVMMVSDDDQSIGFSPKLLDFGFARSLQTDL